MPLPLSYFEEAVHNQLTKSQPKTLVTELHLFYSSYFSMSSSSGHKDVLIVRKRGTDIPLLQKEVVRIT